MQNIQAFLWATILTGSLAYLFYELFGLTQKKQRRQLRWVQQSVRIEKYLDQFLSQNNNARKFTEMFDDLLKRSRLRMNGKPLNKYLFIIILMAGGIVAGLVAATKLNNIVAGLLVLVLLVVAAINLLSWDGKHRKRQLRKQTPNFFLTLLNYYEITHDVVRAIKLTTDKLKNPLKTDFQYLVVHLQSGAPLRELIIDTKQRLDWGHLQDFLDDLELQIRYGGDFSNTLVRYIEDSMDLEKRIMERNSETAGSSLVTYFMFGIFFTITGLLTKAQPEMMKTLVTETVGKVVVVIIIIIMILVLYVTKELTAVEEE